MDRSNPWDVGELKMNGTAVIQSITGSVFQLSFLQRTLKLKLFTVQLDRRFSCTN